MVQSFHSITGMETPNEEWSGGCAWGQSRSIFSMPSGPPNDSIFNHRPVGRSSFACLASSKTWIAAGALKCGPELQGVDQPFQKSHHVWGRGKEWYPIAMLLLMTVALSLFQILRPLKGDVWQLPGENWWYSASRIQVNLPQTSIWESLIQIYPLVI